MLAPHLLVWTPHPSTVARGALVYGAPTRGALEPRCCVATHWLRTSLLGGLGCPGRPPRTCVLGTGVAGVRGRGAGLAGSPALPRPSLHSDPCARSSVPAALGSSGTQSGELGGDWKRGASPGTPQRASLPPPGSLAKENRSVPKRSSAGRKEQRNAGPAGLAPAPHVPPGPPAHADGRTAGSEAPEPAQGAAPLACGGARGVPQTPHPPPRPSLTPSSRLRCTHSRLNYLGGKERAVAPIESQEVPRLSPTAQAPWRRRSYETPPRSRD